MTAIEANSLSTLTHLAANPPQYPRNPSHQQLPPLTLYIARVPGSQDVFLTPMKPKEKVVSAEDVQSSLYFLHIDRPEDQAMRDILAPDRIDDRLPQRSHTIHRKEVGSSPNTPVVGQTSFPPSGQHPQGRPLPSVPRTNGYSGASSSAYRTTNPPYPAGPTSKSFQPPAFTVQDENSPRISIDTNVPTRKAVGTGSVSRHRGLSDVGPTSQKETDVMRSSSIRRKSAQPSPTTYHGGQSGPNPLSDRSSNAQNAYNRMSHVHFPAADPQLPQLPLSQRGGNRIYQPDKAPSNSGTTLTLIRRDPTSGEQWNVAKISDPPVYDVSSESLQEGAKKQQGAPLYIEINNPGYSKFIHSMPDIPTLQHRGTGSTLGSIGSVDFPSSPTQTQESTTTDGVFRRRMWMENSRMSPHQRVRSDDSTDSRRKLSIGIRPSLDWTRQSEPDGVGASSDDAQRIAAVPGTERRSAHAKGYAFMSPWNGRCEFITGATGRALKCKHSLPTVASGSGNTSPAMIVSELRFNLFLGSASRAADAKSRRDNYSSSASDSNRSSTHAKLSAMLDRLDLSLGQELAGGGMGGKQAKLGKLIIEDEGLKMLDLLVAANMSLWWRAYQKVGAP